MAALSRVKVCVHAGVGVGVRCGAVEEVDGEEAYFAFNSRLYLYLGLYWR